MKIMKYRIHEEVLLPKNASILDIQFQDNILVLWALVDPLELEYDSFQFKVFRTGKELDFVPTEWKYGATVQTVFKVWHVYYKQIS